MTIQISCITPLVRPVAEWSLVGGYPGITFKAEKIRKLAHQLKTCNRREMWENSHLCGGVRFVWPLEAQNGSL